MSLLKANAVQLGQSITATNNFTWYQPASPDGTVRLGNGNSGSVTDLVTVGTTGNLTFTGTTETYTNSATISAASTRTLTLNGGAGSNGLVLTSANAVGIGTASPLGNLSISATNPLFALTNSNSVSYSIASFASDNTLRIAKYGVSDFAIFDSSGNLGLGVVPPTVSTGKSLSVGFTGSSIWSASNSGNIFVLSNTYYNGGYKYDITGAASYYQQNSGIHSWYNAPSGTAGNAISFTQAMTLDASGNLLVGATTAYSKLQVNNTANQPASFLYQQYTTSSGTANAVLQLRNDYVTGSNTGYMIAFQNGSAGFGGSITLNGNTTAYNTGSDQRLKTNVIPAGSAIKSILDFPVDQFDWISTGEHQDFGAVAQKAINFIPEMVSVPEDPETMWGIDWSKAVPRLIKTIQELSAEIEILKQKVN